MSGGFCGLNEKNVENDDGFELKARSILERGVYVFEGQNKQVMIQQMEGIMEAERHKYLLKSYQIND